MKTKDILVSIIGLDEPGIVAATAETLTRLGCNIEQMTQTTLRDQFTAGEPFIVSIWGHDRNDIIATFARIFAEQRINVEGLKAFRIEDDQSLQVFEVVIPEQVDTRSLHRIMGERAKRMGLRLSMQHAAIFEAIHRVRVV